jgi:hypothetical protein
MGNRGRCGGNNGDALIARKPIKEKNHTFAKGQMKSIPLKFNKENNNLV